MFFAFHVGPAKIKQFPSALSRTLERRRSTPIVCGWRLNVDEAAAASSVRRNISNEEKPRINDDLV